MGLGHDKAKTVYAEHGLMYEDIKQHQRAAYYYKLALMSACQHDGPDQGSHSVNSILMGVAEAYDAEWQEPSKHNLGT